MYRLVLASQSPRRHELLKKARIKFETYTLKVSEILDENLTLDEAILLIAKTKAWPVAKEILKTAKDRKILVLSADTVVVFKGKVFGKPRDQSHAFEMLSQLSGQQHEVKTSHFIMNLDTDQSSGQVRTSKVWFKSLSEKQIRDYIASGEPMDKAGAYGIQGVGKDWIEKVEGEWDNVMGLSVSCVQEILKNEGWVVGSE